MPLTRVGKARGGSPVVKPVSIILSELIFIWLQSPQQSLSRSSKLNLLRACRNVQISWCIWMANVLIIVLFNLCEIIECLRKRCFCQVTNGLHVSRQLSPDDNCLSSPASGLPLLYLCSLVQHCDNFHQTRAHRPTAGHCCTVNGNFMFLFSAQKASFSIHVIAKYRPMMGKILEHRPLLVTAPWTSHWVTAVIPCKPGQSQRGESYTLSFHGIQSARLVIYESFIQKRSTHKKYLRYQSILILFRQKGRF